MCEFDSYFSAAWFVRFSRPSWQEVRGSWEEGTQQELERQRQVTTWTYKMGINRNIDNCSGIVWNQRTMLQRTKWRKWRCLTKFHPHHTPQSFSYIQQQSSCFQLETIEEPEPPLSPLLPPTTPGGFVFKTEAELEEQTLKEIDLNRKKIREKRAEKRRKQELEGIENLSPER